MKLTIHINLFITRSGIGFKNFRLINESIHRYPGKRLHFWRYAAYQWLFRPTKKLSGNYFLIHNHWCPGYYHWITEALPRLIASADQVTNRTLLLPDSFKHLAPSVEAYFDGPIYWIPERVNLVVENILIPENPPFSGVYDKEVFHTMRDRYVRWCNLPPAGFNKLYVSRGKASRRKIVNEAEGLTWLRSQGFAMIYGEDLSFAQQIAAMQGVEWLISIHGAGLSNMVFLPAGANVIELQLSPQDGKKPDVLYRDLAATMGLHYHVLFGHPASTGLEMKESDISVNWSDLAGLLPLPGSGA